MNRIANSFILVVVVVCLPFSTCFGNGMGGTTQSEHRGQILNLLSSERDVMQSHIDLLAVKIEIDKLTGAALSFFPINTKEEVSE